MYAILIDDHELFRAGLQLLLEDAFEFEQVLHAAGLEKGLELLSGREAPGLIITDLNMPGHSGPESVLALVEAFPEARIVVMSASEDCKDVLDCISAGVDGYIPKSLPVLSIIAALTQVLGGSVYVPRSTRAAAAGAARPIRVAVTGVEHLTDRQKQVLDQLLLGLSSKEIARVLDVAEGTVKIHLAAIYRALGVKSRAEAISRLMAHA